MFTRKEWTAEKKNFFIAWAKACYWMENVMFLLAVEKKIDPEKLYDTFLKANAPQQVNIPGSILRKLETLAKQDNYEAMDFKPAYNEIYGLLAKNFVDTQSTLRPEARILAEEAGWI